MSRNLRASRLIATSLAVVLTLSLGSPAFSAWFIRGDLNQSGALSLTDAVQLLRSLFLGDPAALACRDAADVDDDGRLAVSDAIHLLSFLFLHGPRPGPRDLFPECRYDTTPDALDCQRSEACSSLGVFFACSRDLLWGARLSLLKQEVREAIAQLSTEDQFGIVFFDSTLIAFPASGTPIEATAQAKSEADHFVSAVETSLSGTCYAAGILAALDIASRSTARRRTALFYTDDFLACPGHFQDQYANQTLTAIIAARPEGVPIHVIGVGLGSFDSSWAVRWLRSLAQRTGGSYAPLPR